LIVKSFCLTLGLQSKLIDLRSEEASGMVGVAVKCVEIDQNTECEGSLLGRS